MGVESRKWINKSLPKLEKCPNKTIMVCDNKVVKMFDGTIGSIQVNEAFLLCFTNRLYEYKKPDDERKTWNDPAVIPKMVNREKDDPTVGKPWDRLAVH